MHFSLTSQRSTNRTFHEPAIAYTTTLGDETPRISQDCPRIWANVLDVVLRGPVS